MAPLIISISGVRGIVGESLRAEEALNFGMAFGEFLREKVAADSIRNPLVAAKPGEAGQSAIRNPKVCIGRDSRPSGAMLAAALSAGLMAVGCDTVDLGIVTTPGGALMCRFLQADGGVVLTASHNPIAWNGIKFLRADGIAFPADEVTQIHALYHGKKFTPQDSLHAGQASADSRTHAVHVDTVLQICDKTLIGSRRFKVVLDSVNGAGCVVTHQLLSKLGCEIIHLNDRPTGIFAHTPEPTAENLAALGPVILKHRAAAGFAQDPDADRLALIDEKGAYIGEEYTLALAAKYILGKKPGRAAANLSTSRMIDDIAAAAGAEVIRTPVGEAHVANAMLAHQCVIGGEGNGGVIDLRVVPVRDSLVGIALVLQFLAETGKTLSQLVAEIPRYHMIKTKFPCPLPETKAVLERVRAYYEKLSLDGSVRLDTRDGLRVDLADGWVQLRASNTEPIMRIMAEARNPARANQLAAEMQALAGI